MTRITALALSGVAMLMVSGAVLLLPSGGTAGAATQDVAVGNNFYSPTTLTINVGDTVQWTWPAAPNATQHSVTSDSGSELGSGIQATGTYSHTFTAAGTYGYHCIIHGTAMSGAVTVLQVAAATATNTAPAVTNTAAATNTAGPTSTATRTGTATAVTTGTPVATAIITPTHTSGVSPTAAPAHPTTAPAGGAAGAGAQLPRAGTGGGDEGGGLGWLSVLFGVGGLVALTAAGVMRKRG